MNYILFDDKTWDNLRPLTHTRPVSELRIGIFTIREKWENLLQSKISYLTRDYLSEKYPINIESENLIINSSVLPDNNIIKEINKLKPGESLYYNDKPIALSCKNFDPKKILETFNSSNKKSIQGLNIRFIEKLWHLFTSIKEEIDNDLELIKNKEFAGKLNSSNTIIGNNIYIEEGVKAECAVFNTKTGPIYLGKNSEVMEGSVIRGPFALGESSTVKLNAKIYGPTCIGPHCKVGGEINNSNFIGYANKAHDGFLGQAVIGEWCNIGADTNNSNLKNNYAEVKLWNYSLNKFEKTGLQFCGLIMGDHSKCGINTMFNTGTVVGVSANIFGSGFPRNFIPDFTWGGASGYIEYNPGKAMEVAEKVMARRTVNLSDIDKKILNNIYEFTKDYRKF
ncbi:MAG: GlmU family protein [Marinilabiliales bacterium]